LKSKENSVRTRKLCLAALLAAAATLAHSSCRPAQYEIIRDKNGKSTNKPVKPVTDGEDPSRTGTPRDAPAGPEDQPIEGNVPPTARVEVIWKSESVTRVKVNEPVDIRPSLDTVDPDDIGVSNCVNPGIVKAEYEIGEGGEKRIAERSRGCEPLSVPYVFTATGDYLISMLVTSNENEPAWATMTLRVFEGDTPPPEDGGFTIRAQPMLTGIGQVVTFWGTCTLGKVQVITWQFGDGGSATGRVVTHAYQSTGQYQVDATCTDETGRAEKAKLTIVVIDKPGVKIPGVPDPVVPEANQPDPGQPNPGQPNPGQPNSGQPSQYPYPGEPGQNPAKPDQAPRQQPDKHAAKENCWFPPFF
jgi:hypothetical protein